MLRDVQLGKAERLLLWEMRLYPHFGVARVLDMDIQLTGPDGGATGFPQIMGGKTR